jgi:uncharacterized membrane protein YebE (DUF533 family)
VSPAEKNILKSLVAVAWADGRMESAETSVIEGLLSGFAATDEEEQEILENAETRRTLEEDIPVGDLSDEDRELLFANAALLVQADGKETLSERRVLIQLGLLLGLEQAVVNDIVESVRRTSVRPRA